ncbi:choline kinase cytoplasm [Suillus clintonianus]|uniref:choline kinase cytoplasm n=1 Tax=Suillus clintonianus TaxID=1904413 RepID=UPI001B87ED75|nr:choline kinase cytoplasm [Suillus clintonianus]KAG2155452.1 choline kinase cytoplasm [Suillus clintonianus]
MGQATTIVADSAAAATIVSPSPLMSSSSSSRSLTVLSPSKSSSASLSQQKVTIDVEFIDGLTNAKAKLHPRSYKSVDFARDLLAILVALRVPGWHNTHVTAELLAINKVSGSLTNTIYFVSCPAVAVVPTLLLRIYGPSSGSLISRSHELRMLHILSSRCHFGPRIYGTFANGRIEEYFESVTLVPSDLRDKKISQWIASRMAELHSVDISVVEGPLTVSALEGKGWEIGVKKNVKAWMPVAREVLGLHCVSEATRQTLNMDHFYELWMRYLRWLSHVEKIEGAGQRVFAHNDTQYGNILRLTGPLRQDIPEHHQLIVVDYEYASPNPVAFDIANHFHEWTADYRSSNPHLLDPSRYPTMEERQNFYRAYLAHARPIDTCTSSVPTLHSEAEVSKLERQVRIWSPASHAMWTVWGIVQAQDNLERGELEPEFDYLAYATCRMEGFIRELSELGVQ